MATLSGVHCIFQNQISFYVITFSAREDGIFLNGDGYELLPFGISGEEMLMGTYTLSDCNGTYAYLDGAYGFNITVQPKFAHTIVVYQDMKTQTSTYYESKYQDEIDKSESGFPWVRVIYNLPDVTNETIFIVGGWIDDEDNGYLTYGEEDEDKNYVVTADSENKVYGDTVGIALDSDGELSLFLKNYGQNGTEELTAANGFMNYQFGASYNLYARLINNGTVSKIAFNFKT